MTSDEHDVTRSVYLIVLPNNIPSPLAPESDEEKRGRAEPRRMKDGGGRADAAGVEAARLRPKRRPSRCASISTRSMQRTVALPIPARDYCDAGRGHAGVIYIMEAGAGGGGAAAAAAAARFRSSI